MRWFLIVLSFAGTWPCVAQTSHPVPLARIVPPGQLNGFPNFGSAVANANDLLAVGAPGDSSPTSPSCGQVYVWSSQAGDWSLQQVVFASQALVGDQFGAAVALHGSTLVVGAPGTDGALGLTDLGRVYVFEAGSSGWTMTQMLDGLGGFGAALAMNADTLFVGAPRRNIPPTGPGISPGAVHVFRRDPSGLWGESQLLNASVPVHGSMFGEALSVSGDALAVGARREASLGAVYVFRGQAGVWLQEARLVGSDTSPASYMGSSVSIDGDRVAAGAPEGADLGLNARPGSVYVFERSAAGWSETAKLISSAPLDGARFGDAVAISGGHLAVGAPDDDTSNGTWGRAYVFELAAGTWTQLEPLEATLVGSSLNHFGSELLWNASELFVGSPRESLYPSRAGAVYSFGFFPDAGVTICDGQIGCPCSNDGSAGVGCANSTGVGAELAAFGTTSLGLDRLWFSVHAVPLRTCLLYSGKTMPGGVFTSRGDGLLCFSPPLRVLGRHVTDFTGFTMFGPGLASAGAWLPGQTRVVQAWYRDGGGPCSSSMNSTNALELTFGP